VMIPKTTKSNLVSILKDPFHHFDKFLNFFRAGVIWWSPRSESSIKWGSTRILLTNLTLFG
jgi:hypothetical protein